MIYTDNREQNYRVLFYLDRKTGRSPVKDYIDQLGPREKAKILKYIEFLREHSGVLDEPYSRHIRAKIRELRVDFGRDRHRIFYFTFKGQTIILLHAFLKKTAKTPENEIERAATHYQDVTNNRALYE